MPDIFKASDQPQNPIPQESENQSQVTTPTKEDESPSENFEIPGEDKSPEGLPGHNHNPLTSFCYYPHLVDFLDKEPDERVVLLVRRHFITNIPWIALVIFLAFVPKVFSVFPLISFLPDRFQLVFILFWYLLDIAIFFQSFLSWFFSVNIVTNKRVIDVEFVNLIYRKITDAEISHIEDATVQMGSVIRTIFDYGNVIIETAAEFPDIDFESVPHPDRINKILSDLRLEREQF